MTRYFEFVEGKSAKFWEVEVVSDEVQVRYGRIGADGQWSYKKFDTTEQAQKHADKLIEQKTKKGYVECHETSE